MPPRAPRRSVESLQIYPGVTESRSEPPGATGTNPARSLFTQEMAGAGGVGSEAVPPILPSSRPSPPPSSLPSSPPQVSPYTGFSCWAEEFAEEGGGGGGVCGIGEGCGGLQGV